MPDKYPHTHRMIASMFKMSRRKALEDNLPYCLNYGGRDKLAELFHVLGYKTGVEVGTRNGAYAKILCDANPGLLLTCVDPWGSNQPDGTYQFHRDHNMEKAKRALAPYGVAFIRKTSMDALSDIKDDSLDFVYIDANHTFDYCCPDIIYWSKKVKSGGIVSGHDYFHHRTGGVVEAVDAYTHCHNINPWYVTEEIHPSFFWVKP